MKFSGARSSYAIAFFAMALLAAPARSGEATAGIGTMDERASKLRVKFADPRSSAPAISTVRIGGYSGKGARDAFGNADMKLEELEGIAQNLVVAGAVQNEPPLSGEPGGFKGDIVINEFLGADRFYAAGATGQNTVVASIEGGRAWKEHETLLHAVDIPQNLQPSAIDRHATWTAMLSAGRPTSKRHYQSGIAPAAELHTGGFATLWAGNRYSFAYSFFGNVLFDQYYQAMVSGLSGSDGVRTADVVNSSYSIVGEPAASTIELILDSMATTNPDSVMVMGAGNSGSGVNTIASPATGYNNITVGSLTRTTEYNTPSAFTSGGEIDYSDPVNGVARAARRGVDIAAPGEDLASAYYGGLTGGNAPGLAGPPSGALGGPEFYTRDLDGTSYAAPLVSGGVALMQDAAQVLLPGVAAARDMRVIKAALLNSAHKTEGWDNGQTPHPNGNGGVTTSLSLDPLVGTGRMDLDAAFDQYVSGTTDIAGTELGSQGQVGVGGWDLGRVAEGTPTDYFIDSTLAGGSTFTATLTWFRDRRLVDTGAGFVSIDDNFADLDLEVWSVTEGTPDALISESISPFNSTEHLSFTLPETGDYMVRVRWLQEWFDQGAADPNEALFGLSWSGDTRSLPPGIVDNPGLDGRIPPGLKDGLPPRGPRPAPEPASIAIALSGLSVWVLVRGRRSMCAAEKRNQR
jgi:hypothetical protein